MQNFKKIRRLVVVAFHADGQTDMTKLIVTFLSFAKAPKNGVLQETIETRQTVPFVNGSILFAVSQVKLSPCVMENDPVKAYAVWRYTFRPKPRNQAFDRELLCFGLLQLLLLPNLRYERKLQVLYVAHSVFLELCMLLYNISYFFFQGLCHTLCH
jgi:hypothetical protein